jgi:hypothetical protein
MQPEAAAEDYIAGYLDRVGVPFPGGDPAAIHSSAAQWSALADELGAHIADLADALESAESGQQGETAAELRRQISGVVAQLTVLRQSTADVSQAQQLHAVHHREVLQILRDIAIQIAITVALFAFASIVPGLVSALEARLALLALQAGRAISLLQRSLAALIRTIAEIRAVMQTTLNWGLQFVRVIVPVGRAALEGIRDFFVDLGTNALTAKVEGRSLSVDQLFVAAAISGAAGALLPGLGRMGFRSNPSEKFVSADDLYRRLIPRRPAAEGRIRPESTMRVPSPSVLDNLTEAQAGVTRLGLSGVSRSERDAIGAAVDRGILHTWARQSQVELAGLGDDAARLVRQRQADLASANAKLWSDRAAHQLVGVSGTPELVASSATRLAQSVEQVGTARAALKTAVSLRDEVRALQYRAELIAPASTAHDVVSASAKAGAAHEALENLDHARAQVIEHARGWQQAKHFFRHNRWRDGAATDFHPVVHGERTEFVANDWRASAFDSRPLDGITNPKDWREIIFYHGVKDGFKGTISNLGFTGYQIAEGRASASDLPLAAGLGTVGGSLRGMVKGTAQGRWIPAEGLEEVIWRFGAKGLDKIVSNEVRTAVDGSRLPTPPPPIAADRVDPAATDHDHAVGDAGTSGSAPDSTNGSLRDET